MKKQITALVTYPSGSKHLVCFNKWKWDGRYGITKTYWFSGYVIDSKTFKIGMELCLDCHIFETHGLIETNTYLFWPKDYEVEIIEVEYWPNWYDKLIGRTK